jgi:hypothetical protein
MPNPSRWGRGRGNVNVTCPEWVLDALRDIWKKKDYRSEADAALECIVRVLLEEGYEPPSEVVYPLSSVGGFKRRR